MPVSRSLAPRSRRGGFRGFRQFAPGKLTPLVLCAGFICAARSASASTYLINVQATGLDVTSLYGVSFTLQNTLVGNPLRADVRNFSMTTGQLIDGSGDFSPFGNSPVGALGSASTLSLATTSAIPLSDYTQNFSSSPTGSATMAFLLTLSSAAPQPSSADPDYFQFSILDSSGMPLQTDATDGVSLVYAEFDSRSPVAQAYQRPAPDAPQITVQVDAAPEPGTLALLLPGVAGVGAVLIHRRRRAAAKP